jgi:hypothetical protein
MEREIKIIFHGDKLYLINMYKLLEQWQKTLELGQQSILELQEA